MAPQTPDFSNLPRVNGMPVTDWNGLKTHVEGLYTHGGAVSPFMLYQAGAQLGYDPQWMAEQTMGYSKPGWFEGEADLIRRHAAGENIDLHIQGVNPDRLARFKDIMANGRTSLPTGTAANGLEDIQNGVGSHSVRYGGAAAGGQATQGQVTDAGRGGDPLLAALGPVLGGGSPSLPTGAPAVGGGNQSASTGTPGVGGGGGAAQPGGSGGGIPQTTPITGTETPYQVLPGRSDALQSILDPLLGEARRQLENPSVYDDELFQDALEQGRHALDADLGSRGILWSSGATELFGKNVMLPLLRERAQSIGSARSAAFNNAAGAAGLLSGQEALERSEVRGERGYVDGLRRQARSDAIEELLLEEQLAGSAEDDFQQILARALGYGQGGAGLGALQGAGATLGAGASQYGDQAAQMDAYLAQLAQLFMSGGGES